MHPSFISRISRPIGGHLLSILILGLAAGFGFVRAAESADLPPKAQFQIYLLMGQSNMAGRDTRELESQVENPKVLAMTPDGQWVVAKDPIHQKDGRAEPGAGPGIPFANEMLKTHPDITIGLVPCAVGGSPMKRWVKGADLYERAVERARLAAKSGEIAGVLWLQGETDSDKEPWAKAYEGRLAGMIRDLRHDLGLPQLPVVVGQIGDFLTVKNHPYVKTVRAAIKAVAGKTGRVGYADSSGLDHKGDSLHFDAKSARELGRRFAAAMTALQSK